VEIVDDFMEDIERRAVIPQRPFDGFDGHPDAGAKAAWFGEENFFNRHKSYP